MSSVGDDVKGKRNEKEEGNVIGERKYGKEEKEKKGKGRTSQRRSTKPQDNHARSSFSNPFIQLSIAGGGKVGWWSR